MLKTFKSSTGNEGVVQIVVHLSFVLHFVVQIKDVVQLYYIKSTRQQKLVCSTARSTYIQILYYYYYYY